MINRKNCAKSQCRAFVGEGSSTLLFHHKSHACDLISPKKVKVMKVKSQLKCLAEEAPYSLLELFEGIVNAPENDDITDLLSFTELESANKVEGGLFRSWSLLGW